MEIALDSAVHVIIPFVPLIVNLLTVDRGNKRDKDKLQRQQRSSRWYKSCADQCTAPTNPVSKSTWNVRAEGVYYEW